MYHLVVAQIDMEIYNTPSDHSQCKPLGKLLSVIIPTYNMQDYLPRCVQSLLSAHKRELLEIIVVNDGSKDNSLNIALGYAEKYPDSMVVVDKENANYGSCINAGINVAKGKYIKILDADDCYDTEALDEVLCHLVDVDVDLVITDFVRVYANGKQSLKSYHLQPNTVLDYSQIRFQSEVFKLWMHSAAYRLDNLRKLNYHQTEHISYTDVEWTFLPMVTVNTAYYIKVPLYRYTLGREGQTVDPKVVAVKFGDNVKCTMSMIKSYEDFIMLGDKGAFEQNGFKFNNEENLEMLEKKLLRRIKTIYKFYLVKNRKIDLKELNEMDVLIKKMSPRLYSLSNQFVVSSPAFPYHFVRSWRKNGNSRRFNLMIMLYRLLKYHKL